MDYKGIDYLRNKLRQKRTRVLLRYRYYDMKEYRQSSLSTTIPPWMKGLYSSTVGWNTKSVDTLADRLMFLGFKEDTDYYGTMDIFRQNNPDVFFDSVIKESLIASCSFIQIAHGDGTLIPKLSVLTADNATGVIDEQTGMLKEGYAVLDRDRDGHPVIEAWFTPEATTYFVAGSDPYVETNPADYPLLITAAFRPDSKRPFGHSRISRSTMKYQQLAQNTIERAEVSAEFYSYPQRYATGLSPEADPIVQWKAVMSSFITFDKDEDGDKPTVGQFSQQSMSPYTEQLRTAAALFAGETGLTLDDLGFPTDNPSSAEAIKAAHESLRLTARRAQKVYASAFARAGYLAACVRDNKAYDKVLIADMEPMWEPIFEPDAAALSVVGDGAIKLNQAVPGYFDRENLRLLTGIEGGPEPEPISIEETVE